MKAITWYAQQNNLKPILSAPPTIRFQHPSGHIVSMHINKIEIEYFSRDRESKPRSSFNLYDAKDRSRYPSKFA